MAESVEPMKSMNEFDVFKVFIEVLEKVDEVNLEKRILNEVPVLESANNYSDKMIEALKITKSTLKNMMDCKSAIAKRLKNPITPNAFLLEYKMHENFLKCCHEMPQILSLLRAKKNSKVSAMGLGDDHKLISSMERELKWQKLYISCVKRFLTDLEDYETNFNKLIDFMKENEDNA